MCSATITLAPPLKPRPSRPISAKLAGFAKGTMLRTPFGPRPVEKLMAGDLLLDRDGQIVELRSLRRQMARADELVRVHTDHGVAVLGQGTQMQVNDWRTQVLFGQVAHVASDRLIDGAKVRPAGRGALLHVLGFDRDTLLDVGGVTLLVQAG